MKRYSFNVFASINQMLTPIQNTQRIVWIRILNINQNAIHKSFTSTKQTSAMSKRESEIEHKKKSIANANVSNSKRKYYWSAMKCANIKVKCNKGTMFHAFHLIFVCYVCSTCQSSDISYCDSLWSILVNIFLFSLTKLSDMKAVWIKSRYWFWQKSIFFCEHVW